MSHTIDYAKHNSDDAKHDAAMRDVREWFGDRFVTVSGELRKVQSPVAFRFYCAFGGVSGFPVIAFYEHLHGRGTWIEPE